MASLYPIYLDAYMRVFTWDTLCICFIAFYFRNVSPVEGINVVKKLCTCVHKTDDKTTCSRALWCLGKQNFSPDIIEEQVTFEP